MSPDVDLKSSDTVKRCSDGAVEPDRRIIALPRDSTGLSIWYEKRR